MEVFLAGGRITAEVEGHGPSLVLLHSLLSDRGSFAAVRERLADHFRVIVMDLPGFGGSQPILGTLAEVAAGVASGVFEAADGQRPLVLGNGYGGFVALQMVMDHPDLAARLVLADSGATFSELGRTAFRTMATVARDKGIEAIAEVAMRRLFSPAFQAAQPALLDQRRAAFLRTDPAVLIAACRQLATLDLRDRLHEIALQVLVMVGENDEATPPAMSRELAAGLSNARLTILPGCAHVPQLQDPHRFLAACLPFLTGHDALVSA